MANKLKNDAFRREVRNPLLTVIQKVVCNFDRGSFHVVLGTGLKSEESTSGTSPCQPGTGRASLLFRKTKDQGNL